MGALILTRKIGDTLVIVAAGQTILITLVGKQGNQIRVACDADKSVAINRLSIHNRICAEHNLPEIPDPFLQIGLNNRNMDIPRNNGGQGGRFNGINTALVPVAKQAIPKRNALDPVRNNRQPRCNRSEAEKQVMP